MIPVGFEYVAPDSVQEALALLAGDCGPAAVVLAGGQSLIPLLKLRLSRPALVVDISRLTELREVHHERDTYTFGALVTHSELEADDQVATCLRALQQAARCIGDPAIRNLGTLGGSLVHNDPAADYPAVALALGAEVELCGPSGRRWLDCEEFLVRPFQTALPKGHLLTRVRFPLSDPLPVSRYLRFADPGSGYARCGVCVRLANREGRFSQVRVALHGVGPIARRARRLEAALEGQTVEAIEAALELVTDGLQVDEYAAHLATVLTRRALVGACQEAF